MFTLCALVFVFGVAGFLIWFVVSCFVCAVCFVAVCRLFYVCTVGFVLFTIGCCCLVCCLVCFFAPVFGYCGVFW